jgi:hypothetical protein
MKQLCIYIHTKKKECFSQIQNWVESLFNSPELLLALQTINQKSSWDETSSQTGKSSKSIFKIKAGSSSKKSLLFFNLNFLSELSQNVSKERSDYIKKPNY